MRPIVSAAEVFSISPPSVVAWARSLLVMILLAGCSGGDNPSPPTGGGGDSRQSSVQQGRFNRPVTAMISALDGSGDIYVAGAFTTYNDQPVGSVVRIRPNGSLNETFILPASLNAPPGSGKTVVSIAPVDDGSGDIYVGELISPSTNTLENLGRIWKVNADGSIDPSFLQGEVIDANPDFMFLTSRIHTIVPAGDGSGRAYVCGVFDRYNGTPVQEGIVRVTSTGTVDLTFQHAENSPTHTVVAADDGSGDLYVLSYNILENRSEGSSFLYRLNGDGSLDPGFNRLTAMIPLGLGKINTVVPVGDGSGDLFIGGDFILSPSGSPTDPNAIAGIARVNPDGTLDRTSPRPIRNNFGPTAIVRAVDGTNDWFLGDQLQLIRFKAGSTVDPAFMVGSLTISPDEGFPPLGVLPVSDGSGDLYVGGNIATYNGAPVGHILRLNGNGTLDGR